MGEDKSITSVDVELVSTDLEARRKVKGQIHWISPDDSIDCEVRLYERLFTVEDPSAVDDLLSVVNKESLVVKKRVKIPKRIFD